jgi:hypothetical protein
MDSVNNDNDSFEQILAIASKRAKEKLRPKILVRNSGWPPFVVLAFSRLRAKVKAVGDLKFRVEILECSQLW